MREPSETCQTCYLRKACPIGSLVDAGRAPALGTFRSRKLASRETLLQAGQPARSLYVVRSGMLKSYAITTSGGEHVRALHLPGDLVGIDAVMGARCTSFAGALEPSHVCGIEGPEAWSLAGAVPEFRRRLVGALSQRIERGQDHACALARLPAGQRVAALLSELSLRFARLGYACHGFELKFPRRDMANYLGLTVETVSRAVTWLQGAGLVSSRRTCIVIRDPERLSALAHARPLAGGARTWPARSRAGPGARRSRVEAESGVLADSR